MVIDTQQSSSMHSVSEWNTVPTQVENGDISGARPMEMSVRQSTDVSFIGVEAKTDTVYDERAAKYRDGEMAAANSVILQHKMKSLEQGMATKSAKQEEELHKLRTAVKDSELKTKELSEDLEQETERSLMYKISEDLMARKLDDTVLLKDFFDVLDENRSLRAQVDQLTIENASKEPLVHVGADIRLRFLEQAGEVGNRNAYFEPYQELLRENGNMAAHYGNVAADEALFSNDFIPQGYTSKATKIFRDLYQTHPNRHSHWDRFQERITNCLATQRSHRRTDSSAPQREKFSAMLKEFDNLQASDASQLNSLATLVTEMELLNDKIADLDLRTRRA